MKFHELARHNQFATTATSVNRANQPQNNQLTSSQRGLTSSKVLHRQLQQATSEFRNEQKSKNNNMSDQEDDDHHYNRDQANYFDTTISQSNQKASLNSPSSHQQQASKAKQKQNDSNFLLDKNKKLFPQKLWELIHNPSIQHCLRWSQDGQRVYLNRNEFEAYYLKTPNNQFHTQKAISFVRQMNMYGFRKVDDCYYENDNFRRDRHHLLRNMIRRHPNKSLFVGLDHHHHHHQLAAAAAARQALQVNQQLQQMENQDRNISHNVHSSPFNHISTSQLMAQVAAANQLSQQQQQQQQQQQSQLATTMTCNTNNNLNKNHLPPRPRPYQQNKKSRLLGNFYAKSPTNVSRLIQAKQNSLGNGGTSQLGINSSTKAELGQSNEELLHSQDSMHSTSSVESGSSRCSSLVNSASSPQLNSPNSLDRVPGSLAGQLSLSHQQGHSSVIRAAVLVAAAAQQQQQQQQLNPNNSKFEEHQLTATDLSQQNNQQHDLASRQAALHQTLVRSLLQLKQLPNQQELLANILSSNNSHFLLGSMESSSSAGTNGSIADPTSNSTTKRSVTPPSIPSSPVDAYNTINSNNNNNNSDTQKGSYVNIGTDNNNMVLNLAKSSSSTRLSVEKRKVDNFYKDDDDETFDEVEDLEIESDARSEEVKDDGSSLGGEKKMRRFLAEHMQQRTNSLDTLMIKRKLMESEPGEEIFADSTKKKKLRLSGSSIDQNQASFIENDDDNISISSISKSLILEFCDKRGDRLEINALNEAARYTECFLDVLLENASTIARNNPSSSASTSSITSNESHFNKELNIDGYSDGSEEGFLDDEKISSAKKSHTSYKGSLVDTSSLSLALKLIPSKLIAAIEQQ